MENRKSRGVSIPHRYYKSPYFRFFWMTANQFQFLIGIINLVPSAGYLYPQGFQFLIGIINRFKRNISKSKWWVSIPHRYYKSYMRWIEIMLSLLFQFLIGIINHFIGADGLSTEITFQFLIGIINQVVYLFSIRKKKRFQFLIGIINLYHCIH